MSKYEAAYGKDWDALDKEEAVERAYALGVAELLGEYDRDEVERIRAEMDTAYQKSIVELAFEEGRNEAKDLRREADAAGEGDVWKSLVEDVPVPTEDDLPTGGRDGLPESLGSVDVLDRPDPNENNATDRPDFLDR
ncbi:hypothetical protein VB773_05140 [Haloarculaceae archaeon H-GB2-1]|nr:hypothetical protein [Haloarculaceae archaeon H-GB1-1]MEA5407021.1 hypothetical protein [Haloarculaceae archaeon H-GB2-1]